MSKPTLYQIDPDKWAEHFEQDLDDLAWYVEHGVLVTVERCEHGNIDPHLGPYIGKDGTVTVGNYPCLGADLGGDEDE